MKGWNSQAHGGSGKLESSNLSRDNVGREIGRILGVHGGIEGLRAYVCGASAPVLVAIRPFFNQDPSSLKSESAALRN